MLGVDQNLRRREFNSEIYDLHYQNGTIKFRLHSFGRKEREVPFESSNH